jgi:hypothetical protein
MTLIKHNTQRITLFFFFFGTKNSVFKNLIFLQNLIYIFVVSKPSKKDSKKKCLKLKCS